ncbi:hypothetical protein BC833DRAFT_565294 [Globomyces pollinis-pini]|nr:hypothetical protein BC833DRAFT_565294 [Globomyces pollinis-pini]
MLFVDTKNCPVETICEDFINYTSIFGHTFNDPTNCYSAPPVSFEQMNHFFYPENCYDYPLSAYVTAVPYQDPFHLYNNTSSPASTDMSLANAPSKERKRVSETKNYFVAHNNFKRFWKPILIKLHGCEKKVYRLVSYKWQKLTKQEQLQWLHRKLKIN